MYNPYKILGVSSFDDLITIKAKYRELSKKYHPDNLITGDAEKFQEVNKAWEYIQSLSPQGTGTKKSGKLTDVLSFKTIFQVKRRKINL